MFTVFKSFFVVNGVVASVLVEFFLVSPSIVDFWILDN